MTMEKRLVVFGEQGQRTAIDLASVNAVVEGPNGFCRVHIRGDREGFGVDADFDQLVELVERAKGPRLVEF